MHDRKSGESTCGRGRVELFKIIINKKKLDFLLACHYLLHYQVPFRLLLHNYPFFVKNGFANSC